VKAAIPTLIWLPVFVLIPVFAFGQPLAIEDAFTNLMANSRTVTNTTDLTGYQFGMFAAIWAAVNDPLQQAVVQVNTALATQVMPWLKPSATLFAMVALIAAQSGKFDFGLPEVIRLLLRLGVIMFLISPGGPLNSYIVPLTMHDIPDQLLGALSGAVGGAPIAGGEPFDLFVAKAFFVGGQVLDRLPNEWSWKWIAAALCVPLYWLTCFGAALGAFAVVLFVHVVSGLLAAITALAIACALIPATRHWFGGWLNTTVGLIVAKLMVGVLLALMMAMAGQFLDKITTTPQGGNVFAMIGGLIGIAVAMAGTAVVSMVLPGYGRAVAGGAYVNTTQMAGQAWGAAQLGYGTVRGWVSGGSSGGGVLPAPSPGGGFGSRAWTAANHSAGRVQGYQP